MESKQQIGQPGQATTTITAAAFTSKYQSKAEVYRFLATEVGAYLSSYNTVTV